ncbi:MAG: nucleotidyltransferase domain-containing protein [Thermodesulfovibrionales bacterium]|nr:nucleotidyltransferase domain-containing protein [Thermodesulfovibrionales bacterium]
MLKIIKERKKEQEERFKIALAYVQRLSSYIGQFSAILYGSTARGDFKDWSDIDILIISDDLPIDPMERLDFLYDFSEGLIEPKGFTIEEFRAIIDKPFGKLLNEEGIVLKDELNLFREAKN